MAIMRSWGHRPLPFFPIPINCILLLLLLLLGIFFVVKLVLTSAPVLISIRICCIGATNTTFLIRSATLPVR